MTFWLRAVSPTLTPTQVDFLRRELHFLIDSSAYSVEPFRQERSAVSLTLRPDRDRTLKRFGEILGFRSIMFVPLMRECAALASSHLPVCA